MITVSKVVLPEKCDFGEIVGYVGKAKGEKQKGTFYFFSYLGLPRGGREDSNSSCVPVDACHGVSEGALSEGCRPTCLTPPPAY
jgi:hypothetical protein